MAVLFATREVSKRDIGKSLREGRKATQEMHGVCDRFGVPEQVIAETRGKLLWRVEDAKRCLGVLSHV